jgi:hypothetical protein
MKTTIFLDIDGVLNYWGPQEDIIELPALGPFCSFNRKPLTCFVDALEKVKDKVQIVISSTWRLHVSLEEFKEIHLAVPEFKIISDLIVDHETDWRTIIRMKESFRGGQISQYLEDHPGLNYICIDDGGDFFDDQPLLKTDGRYGFTEVDGKYLIDYVTDYVEI